MSRRLLKDALYSARKLFEYANDLSFASRYDYEIDTRLAIAQLHEAGIPISHVKHFKEKYIKLLVERWQEEGLSIGTLKNRVTKLRYVAKKINKPTIIPSNDVLGLGSRPTAEKNRAIRDIDIKRFTQPHIQHSIRLQELFGLRREESMKFILSQADKGTYLVLKGSWTKGGISRTVPVTTKAQRDFLNQLHTELKRGQSLIREGQTYVQQRNVYKWQVSMAGYANLHGLRHAYAQDRYRALTASSSNTEGWDCPFNGGMLTKNLTPEQKTIDHQVRLQISEEMGHSRKSITRTYIG